MANIKSAKKRILVSQVRAERNKAIKSGVKTAIKKVYAAVDANDQAAAKEALVNATFEFVYLNSGLAVNLPTNATLFIFITSSY